MAVTDYDATPANNTTISGIAIGEGLMAPNSTNNVIRQLMADIAALRDTLVYTTGDETITGQLTLNDNTNESLRLSYDVGGSRSPIIGFYDGFTTSLGQIQALSTGLRVFSALGGDLRVKGSGDLEMNGNDVFHNANFRLGAETSTTVTLPSGVGGNLTYDAPAGHVLTGITINRDTSENIQSLTVDSRPVQYLPAGGSWTDITAA